MVRNVPHLAMIPLVILWFGIDEAAKLFLVALGVFFPIYLNTLHGIRTVDPQLIEMGRSYGMSRSELFRRVIFPGRAAIDLRRLSLCARHHVADADRRRDHRRFIRHRLHGDAGARVHAGRCRDPQHPDLRAARQARRQHLAAARAADACRGIRHSRNIEEVQHDARHARQLRCSAQPIPVFEPAARLAPAKTRSRDRSRACACTFAACAKRSATIRCCAASICVVPAGQFVAIVGRSGCGKSTLAAADRRPRRLRCGQPLSSSDGGRAGATHVAGDVPGAAAAAMGAGAVECGSRPRHRTQAKPMRASARGAALAEVGPDRQAVANGLPCCRADRSSASRWRARWSATRRCSPSTSRSARSMR